MKKFTTVAATLAMMLVASVPAYAQTTVDNSDNEVDIDGRFSGNNIAINDSEQFGGDQRLINGDGNVNINEQEQDSNAFAGDVEFFENNDRGFYYDEDEDFDGIADIFDFVVLYGDFDNDGVNDEFENGFDGQSVVIAQ